MTGPMTMENVARDVAGPRMKRAGFHRRNNLFYRWAEGNLALLHLSSSSPNLPGYLYFGINQGVASARIADALGQTIKISATLDGNVHWDLGAPMYDLPGGGTFAIIDDNPAVAEMFERMGAGGLDDFIRTLDVMVADLVRHLSDEVLRDEWLEGANDRISGPWASLNALILTRDLGPAEEHARLVRKLRRLLARGDENAVLARERGLI